MVFFRQAFVVFLLPFIALTCDPKAPILHHIRPPHAFAKQNHRVVITGGPGVGKTSIIRYLREKGYAVVDEAATDVIRRAINNGIHKPWESQEDFNDAILDLQCQRQEEIADGEVTFLDRSVVDTFTYALLSMGPTKSLKTMTDKVQATIDQQLYHQTVFFIDHLNTCENDEIRHENMDELHLIERRLEENYRALGFKIVRVGRDSVENRAKKILEHLGIQ